MTLVVLKLLVGLLAVVVTELGLGSLWGLGAPADYRWLIALFFLSTTADSLARSVLFIWRLFRAVELSV